MSVPAQGVSCEVQMHRKQYLYQIIHLRLATSDSIKIDINTGFTKVNRLAEENVGSWILRLI